MAVRFVTLCMFSLVVVEIDGGGYHAKQLLNPVQDSKFSESILTQHRQKPDSPPVLRKLSSKRMLRPKKYRGLITEKELPEVHEEEFVIYVPEEDQAEADVINAPVVVPGEQKEENSKEAKVMITIAEKPMTSFEEGAKKTNKEENHASSVGKSGRGYDSKHEKHKVEKDHHTKQEKAGKFEEASGDERKFNEGDDYEEGQHEEDDGKKGSKYEDEGENDEGHTTKGTHNVRKKDEYVKKVEFFDEYHDDSDEDRDEDHEDEMDYQTTHHDRKFDQDSAYIHDDYNEHQNHEDMQVHSNSKGKHNAQSHSDRHNYEDKHAKKSKRDDNKKTVENHCYR